MLTLKKAAKMFFFLSKFEHVYLLASDRRARLAERLCTTAKTTALLI